MAFSDTSGSLANGGLAVMLWAAGVSLMAGPPAKAHSTLAGAIHHNAHLAVSRANVDLTIELVFQELASLAERRRMDTDGDGGISQPEVDAYLEAIGPVLDDGLVLRLDGQHLTLIRRFDPELDLFGATGVKGGRHVLKLFYFARTPPLVGSEFEVSVEDRLWVDVPAISMLQVAGEGGVQAVAEGTSSDPCAPSVSKSARVLRARCRLAPIEAGTLEFTQSSTDRRWTWVAVLLLGCVIGVSVVLQRRLEVRQCNAG